MSYASTDKKVYAAIFVDGHRVTQGVADSGHGFWDQTSFRAIMHVTSGQKITLKNAENTSDQFYGDFYTTFSGALIKAD